MEEEVVTKYTDIATNNRVAEYSHAKNHNNFANGEILYRVNSDRVYLTNNLNTYLSFDRRSGTVLVNGLQQNEYVKPPRRIVSDELEMVNRLKNGKHLNSLAYVSYNYLPIKLLTAQGMMQELDQQVFFFLGGGRAQLSTIPWAKSMRRTAWVTKTIPNAWWRKANIGL